MQKIKTKYINNLLNYQPFLKNNYLNKNIKNTIFQKNNLKFNLIEVNNYKKISLPILEKIKQIYTIKTQYNEQFLFNYNLNYNIIFNFNKIVLKNLIKKNKIVKGRIIGGNNKKFFVYIFGLIFLIDSKKLNVLCNNKKKAFNFNKLKKKGYSFNKLIKVKQIIKCYKLRNLNFNIDLINNNHIKNKKFVLSRISYIERLIQNQKIKLNNLMFKKKKEFFQENYMYKK